MVPITNNGWYYGWWIVDSLIAINDLVGGLEQLFLFPYIGNKNPNWLVEGLKPPIRISGNGHASLSLQVGWTPNILRDFGQIYPWTQTAHLQILDVSKTSHDISELYRLLVFFELSIITAFLFFHIFHWFFIPKFRCWRDMAFITRYHPSMDINDI